MILTLTQTALDAVAVATLVVLCAPIVAQVATAEELGSLTGDDCELIAEAVWDSLHGPGFTPDAESRRMNQLYALFSKAAAGMEETER